MSSPLAMLMKEGIDKHDKEFIAFLLTICEEKRDKWQEAVDYLEAFK